LQAFDIEAQSSTLMSMGVADELHGFIDQLITWPGDENLAEERGEPTSRRAGTDPQRRN
jgi:hypothetical protein